MIGSFLEILKHNKGEGEGEGEGEGNCVICSSFHLAASLILSILYRSRKASISKCTKLYRTTLIFFLCLQPLCFRGTDHQLVRLSETLRCHRRGVPREHNTRIFTLFLKFSFYFSLHLWYMQCRSVLYFRQ